MHNPAHLFIRCNYQIAVRKGEQGCALQGIYRKCVSVLRVEGSFREYKQAYAKKPF